MQLVGIWFPYTYAVSELYKALAIILHSRTPLPYFDSNAGKLHRTCRTLEMAATSDFHLVTRGFPHLLS
jgi:hypothetical protein